MAFTLLNTLAVSRKGVNIRRVWVWTTDYNSTQIIKVKEFRLVLTTTTSTNLSASQVKLVPKKLLRLIP